MRRRGLPLNTGRGNDRRDGGHKASRLPRGAGVRGRIHQRGAGSGGRPGERLGGGESEGRCVGGGMGGDEDRCVGGSVGRDEGGGVSGDEGRSVSGP
jgi:hypothetical protein